MPIKNRYFNKGHLPFLILFFLMFIINHYVYLNGDDYRYASYFGLSEQFKGQPFTLKNIIETQLYDYKTVNGRLILNILDVIFTNHLSIWKFINPLLITLLAYATFFIVFVRQPKKEDVFFTSVIGFLFLTMNLVIFKQTINYVTGAVNYVYSMLFLFILIALLRKYEFQPSVNKKTLIAAGLFGFLAGWSQEQVSIMSVGYVILWILNGIVTKREIKAEPLIILGTVLLGALFLFLSPGLKLRAHDPGLSFFYSLSLPGRVIYSTPGILRFFISQQSLYVLLAAFSSSLLCYQKSRHAFCLLLTPVILIPFTPPILGYPNDMFSKLYNSNTLVLIYGFFIMISLLIMNLYLSVKEKDYLFLTLTLGFLSADLVMVLTPATAGGRTAFPAIPISISLIILTLTHLKFPIVKSQLSAFLALYAGITYLYFLNGYYDNASIEEKRIQIIQENKNNETIVLPSLKNRLFVPYDINDQKWITKAYKTFYKIDESVKVLVHQKH